MKRPNPRELLWEVNKRRKEAVHHLLKANVSHYHTYDCIISLFPTHTHTLLLLLLLLSHFSCVRLCATPETAAHQAPPSLGFSRQEHWSGLPLPSPMHESEKWKWSRSVVSPTLSDAMDCSLPGFSVHGIFQARVLEWGAIAFSAHIHWVQPKSTNFLAEPS